MGQSPAAVPLQVVLNVKIEGNRGEKKKKERGEREWGRERETPYRNKIQYNQDRVTRSQI